jgi:MbtH protein
VVLDLSGRIDPIFLADAGDGPVAGGVQPMAEEAEDRTIYRVVLNHEEQYSIWPADREAPSGWKDAGKTGTKEECLSFVDEVWTDMRPLSLRQAMSQG